MDGCEFVSNRPERPITLWARIDQDRFQSWFAPSALSNLPRVSMMQATDHRPINNLAETCLLNQNLTPSKVPRSINISLIVRTDAPSSLRETPISGKPE